MKNRLKGSKQGGEILRVVMKVMIKPQGQIDHNGDFGDDLGAAAETGDEVTNVAVVLLDGESQVFAGEELILRNEAVKPFPIVGQEGFALDANFIEELLTGGIITATKHPGDGAPTHRVIRSPNPELFSLFLLLPRLRVWLGLGLRRLAEGLLGGKAKAGHRF